MIFIMNTSIIPPNFEGTIKVKDLSIEEARFLLLNDWTSSVGHESSAVVLSLLLGKEIPMNRISIQVESGDYIIAFQLKERLPEGFTPNEEDLLNLDYKLRLLAFVE